MSLFEHTLPVDAARDAATKKPPAKKPPPKKKPGGGKKEGPVRTQMIGEKPGDDLGYDPSKIPVEDIE